MAIRRWRWCLLILLGMVGWACAAPQAVLLYNYYDAPPFITVPGEGLSYALATHLNTIAHERYQFTVVRIPRRRLNLLIEQNGGSWVVAWANPVWFGDAPRQRYFWSEPLLQDRDWWLSRRDHPLDPAALPTANGLILGGLLGHRYVDLDDAVAAGRIKRYDALDYPSSMHMLAAGRVDFITIPDSVLGSLRHQYAQLLARMQTAPRGEPYTRFLFSPRSDPALAAFVHDAVQQLTRDPDWQAEVAHWRGNDVVAHP